MPKYRQATWASDATAKFQNHLYVVVYKHHIDKIETDNRQFVHMFNYTAIQHTHYGDISAWDWIEEISYILVRTKKVIVAEPEWTGGKLYHVSDINHGSGKLSFVILEDSFEYLKVIQDSVRPAVGWTPDGYADEKSIWNHRTLRS